MVGAIGMPDTIPLCAIQHWFQQTPEERQNFLEDPKNTHDITMKISCLEDYSLLYPYNVYCETQRICFPPAAEDVLKRWQISPSFSASRRASASLCHGSSNSILGAMTTANVFDSLEKEEAMREKERSEGIPCFPLRSWPTSYPPLVWAPLHYPLAIEDAHGSSLRITKKKVFGVREEEERKENTKDFSSFTCSNWDLCSGVGGRIDLLGDASFQLWHQSAQYHLFDTVVRRVMHYLSHSVVSCEEMRRHVTVHHPSSIFLSSSSACVRPQMSEEVVWKVSVKIVRVLIETCIAASYRLGIVKSFEEKLLEMRASITHQRRERDSVHNCSSPKTLSLQDRKGTSPSGEVVPPSFSLVLEDEEEKTTQTRKKEKNEDESERKRRKVEEEIKRSRNPSHVDAADGNKRSHFLSIPLKKYCMLSSSGHPDYVSSIFRPSNGSSSSSLLAVALLLGWRHPLLFKRKEERFLSHAFNLQEELHTSLSGKNKNRKLPYVASSSVIPREDNGKEGREEKDLKQVENTLHPASKNSGSGMNAPCAAGEKHSSDDHCFLNIALLRKEMSSHKSVMRSIHSSSHAAASSILTHNESITESHTASQGFPTLHDISSLSKLVDRKTNFCETSVHELSTPILPLKNLISSKDISAAFILVSLPI